MVLILLQQNIRERINDGDSKRREVSNRMDAVQYFQHFQADLINSRISSFADQG
jgi:hypothetical protein